MVNTQMVSLKVKWLKTLLLSTVVFFIPLMMLFKMDHPLSIGDVAISFLVAIGLGFLVVYFRFYSRKNEVKERVNIDKSETTSIEKKGLFQKDLGYGGIILLVILFIILSKLAGSDTVIGSSLGAVADILIVVIIFKMIRKFIKRER